MRGELVSLFTCRRCRTRRVFNRELSSRTASGCPCCFATMRPSPWKGVSSGTVMIWNEVRRSVSR